MTDVMSVTEWRRRVDRSMSEKAWQEMIVGAADCLGWLCYHTYDSRRSEPGFPDLVCIRDGALVFIECKTERGKTTPAQEAWLALLDTVPGVTAMVARPSDWDRVEATLKGEAA